MGVEGGREGGAFRLHGWECGANLSSAQLHRSISPTTVLPPAPPHHAGSGQVTARPGVVRLMDEARAAGVPVAVCSAATKSAVEFVLSNLLGADRFTGLDLFMAGDDVKQKKPDPTIYKVWGRGKPGQAVRQAGCPPARLRGCQPVKVCSTRANRRGLRAVTSALSSQLRACPAAGRGLYARQWRRPALAWKRRAMGHWSATSLARPCSCRWRHSGLRWTPPRALWWRTAPSGWRPRWVPACDAW